MSLVDKMKGQMLKQVLPMALEYVPEVEINIAGYIASQELRENEKRAVSIIYSDDAKTLTIALVATDNDDAPVRIIEKMIAKQLLEKLLKNQ